MADSKILSNFDAEAEPSTDFKRGFIYGLEMASVMVRDGLAVHGDSLTPETRLVISNIIIPTLFDTAQVLYQKSFPQEQAQTGTQNHEEDQDTVPERSGN